MKLPVKIALAAAPLAVLAYGVSMSVDAVEAQSMERSEVHRYGKSNFVPDWMPKPWVGEFLRAIHLDIDESLFQRTLHEMVGTLSSSPWVRQVNKLERNFKGDLALSLDVRKPICVLKQSSKRHYMDAETELLSPLSYKNMRMLADGVVLPEVDVSGIVQDEAQDRHRWLLEVSSFINEWNGDPDLSHRLELDLISMTPYRSKQVKECRLRLKVKDRQFDQELEIEWGVHRDYNELEDRTSDEKWSDLLYAIGQGRPIRSLDLRYKRPEMVYEKESSFFDRR